MAWDSAIRALLKRGADINDKDRYGRNALAYAASGDPKISTMRLLIEKGANANWANSDGYTLLMNAALLGQAETVTILLDAGADTRLKDRYGKTAFDYAKNEEISALLRR